jgi:D-sedoheptulose 7-phosphate isomerase
MNNLKKIYNKKSDFYSYFIKYGDYLSKVLKTIDKKEILSFEKKLQSLRNSDANIYVFGNGGAASTAITMSNDLGFDILKKTKKKPFKLVCLNENQSVITAIGNDVGFENIFLNQLKIHFRPKKDAILILSASGNSKNLIEAAKWVKKNNGTILSILGFDGGKIKKISDFCIHIKTNKSEYGIVEDIQLIINHTLAHWCQNKF